MAFLQHRHGLVVPPHVLQAMTEFPASAGKVDMIARIDGKLNGFPERLLGLRQPAEPAERVAARRARPARCGSERRFAPERAHSVSLCENLLEAAELAQEAAAKDARRTPGVKVSRPLGRLPGPIKAALRIVPVAGVGEMGAQQVASEADGRQVVEPLGGSHGAPMVAKGNAVRSSRVQQEAERRSALGRILVETDLE